MPYSRSMPLILVLFFVILCAQTSARASPVSNVTSTKWPCGKCICSHTFVNCSNRKLTKVPTQYFPRTAEIIILKNNSIVHLPDGTFSNFTSLKHLDLSSNQLKHLRKGVFTGLTKLEELNLTENYLQLGDEAYPPGVFQPLSSSLTALHLEGNCRPENSSRISDSVVSPIQTRGKLTSVQQDWLYETSPPPDKTNDNVTYPDTALSDLRNLRNLSMDGLPDTSFGPGFAKMTKLHHLHLTRHCALRTLTNQSFVNLPHSLTLLNISGCEITDIEADAFRPLRWLRTLDLSENLDLGFDTLATALFGLQGSNLSDLRINRIVHRYSMSFPITAWHTRYFRNTNIETISASFNDLESFCEGALDNMPNTLRKVNLLANRLKFGRYLKDLHKLTNLEELLVDGKYRASSVPDYYPPPPSTRSSSRGIFCAMDQRGDSDNSKISVVSRSEDTGPVVYRLPPNLKVLSAQFNQLYFRLDEINFDPNNSLHTLDLRSNLLAVWSGPITGLNLSTLSLSNNHAKRVQPTFFKTFTSLKSLNVTHNYLKWRVLVDKDGRLFEPLVNLEVLDLSKNRIYTIPTNFFKGLFSLKSLLLASNSIQHFTVKLGHMTKLEMLDLTYNNIQYFPQTVMNQLDNIAARSSSTLFVAIYYNHVLCTCQHIDFLTWTDQPRQPKRVQFNDSNNYKCITSDGQIKKSMSSYSSIITELQRSCADMTGVLVGSITCSFCLLIAAALALAYRFRWKLRYLYYATRLKYSRLQMNNDSFEYDAFISYASEDSEFVHGELLQRLEQGAGLKLNVHNRDWVPGRPIPSNIVASVQSCRRTLVVLTKQLLQSAWCRYEMQMATMEAAHTGREVLLFLLYEDVENEDLPREVFYNLKKSTYIQYPHKQRDNRVVDQFWKRLALAVKE